MPHPYAPIPGAAAGTPSPAERPAGAPRGLALRPNRSLGFEQVVDAASGRATFVSRGPGHTVALTDAQATIRVAGRAGVRRPGASASTPGSPATLRLRLLDGRAQGPLGLEPRAGVVYHVARGRGRLAPQRVFGRVRYPDVYPGIDAVYHADAGRLQFDFLVAPHADPSRIRLGISGAENVALSGTGDLVLRAGGEEVRVHAPVSYQDRPGGRRPVESRFVLAGDATVRVALGDYDPSIPLVIDPTIAFADYIGSDQSDSIVAVESDPAGNVYVFGSMPVPSGAVSFPPTHLSGPQAVSNATLDCYIAKYVSDGAGGLEQAYLALFHDSTGCDAMDLSPAGEVYIARRSADPGVVVESLSEASGSLQLESRFVLPQLATASRVRADADGNAYVIGECAHEGFAGELWPLPGEGFQPGPPVFSTQCKETSLAGAPGGQHLLVAAGPTGFVFYGSFFGFGTSQIEPTALEIDDQGLVYIAGHTNVGPGATIITTSNALQPQPGDSACVPGAPGCKPGDAFLIVVDPRQAGPPGTASLPYASYVGGTSRESDVEMTLEGAGVVHLFGNTESQGTFPGTSFAATSAVFQIVLDVRQPAGAQHLLTEAIVADGRTILLHAHQSRQRARLMPDGRAALVLWTDDPDFPLVDPLFLATRTTSSPDVNPLLLVHDTRRHATVLATYLDDANLAYAAHLAPAADGSLFVALLTSEQGRATTGLSPLGEDDVLLLEITGMEASGGNTPPIANAGGDPQILQSASAAGTTVLLYGGLSWDPDGDALSYSWTEGATTLGTSSLIEVFLTPGDHSITLTVDDGRGGTDSHTVTVSIVPNTPAGGPLSVTPQDAGWVNWSTQNRHPVTVRFANVLGTGYTSVGSRHVLPPVPPPSMQFGSPPLLYDVATTATFTGDVEVCVDYRGNSFATPDAAVQIYREVGGIWVPEPQVNDTGSRSVCTTTATLGTFALFTPAQEANEVSLLAGQPVRAATCTPTSGLDPNEGGLATNSSLCSARGLAYDAARNYLYFAHAGSGDAIRRVDLTTRRITTVAGTGFLPGALDGTGGDLRDDDQNDVDPLTAPLNQVLALALDPAGNLYVGEYGTARIRRIDFTQNRMFTVRALGTFGQPSSMAVDASGALVFASFAGPYQVFRLTPGADGSVDGSADEQLQVVAGIGGNTGFDASGFPAAGVDPRQIAVPASALAFGPDGSLFLTGWSGNAFALRIAPGADGLVDGVDDTAYLVAGSASSFDPGLGDGNAATHGRLYFPTSIAVAPNGDVYVGDTGNPSAATVRRIRAVDGLVTGAPDEILSTVAGFHVFDPSITSGDQLPFSDGDGHALSSIFGAAFDLLVMPSGDLLVNDFHQVRRIGPRGGGSGDSTPPVLTLPGPIVAEAQDPAGAVVGFVATALDEVDGSVPVTCTPGSGSTFAFDGASPTSTLVSCSATDAAGNTATGSFTVTVRDTTAPAVTPPASIVVAATEATGARANVPQAPDTAALLAFLGAGSASDAADPAPARLSPRRVDCADPSQGVAIVEVTLFPVGTNCVALVFLDASGNVGTAVATFEVAPPIGGHVNTAGVPVVATDLQNVPQPVTTTFVALGQPGLVTAVPVAPGVAPPAGVTFPGPAFDIRSTALAAPAVAVCVTLPGAVEAADRLFLLDNGTWLDRTASVDVGSSQICGLETALGIFAVGHPSVVVVSVTETIVVGDSTGVLPAAMIGVSEHVTVSDAPGVLPSALIGITESIVVTDTPSLTPQPSAQTPEGANVRVQATNRQGDPQPVFVTFAQVTVAGTTTAVPLASPPPMPPGFRLRGVVYDIETTATYVPPVTVCITGSFGRRDRLYHYEGGAWRNVTISRTPTEICGRVATLSPFAAAEPPEIPPTLTLPPDQTVEATGPAGAVVTFAASAVSADGNELVPACAPASGSTFALGVTTVACSASDEDELTATGGFTVTVRDTTPPVVTAPPAITVAATEAGGARGSASPALAAFLAGGSAADLVDPAPVRLAATVGGSPVTDGTLFEVGKTTSVAFGFRDASGNVATATSAVRVIRGTPRIKVRVIAQGTVAGTRRFFDLQVTNGGDGNARRVMLDLLLVLPLKGSGLPRLVEPRLPYSVGDLDAGRAATVRVVVDVPATVKQMSLTEAGTFRTVTGALGGYVENQVVTP